MLGSSKTFSLFLSLPSKCRPNSANMFRDRPILLMALGQITVWASLLYIFPALLLYWEAAFGWARPQITGAITLAILISAFAAPAIGKWIDQGFGGPVMGFGCVLGAFSLYMLSFIDTLWQFYLCWSFIGLAFACTLYEPCFAIVTRCRGQKAKQAIISITLLAGFAGAFSFPLAHVLTEMYGWEQCVRIFAIVILLVSAPALWSAATRMEKERHLYIAENNASKDAQELHLARMPLFWLLAVGFAMLGIAHGVTLYHLLAILDQRTVSKDLAVTVAAFIGPMQVTGRLIMTISAPHVSNHGVAAFCFICLALSIFILALAGSNPSLLVLFVILFGGSYGIVSIIRPVVARDLLGETQFGAKSGALALVYLIGSAVAPLLGALIWRVGGYSVVLITMIALCAIGLILYLYANHLKKSHCSTSQQN